MRCRGTPVQRLSAGHSAAVNKLQEMVGPERLASEIARWERVVELQDLCALDVQ